MLALGDHPVVDLLADLLDVVDPLDPHVHQLDPVAGDQFRRPRQDQTGQLIAAFLDPLADFSRQDDVFSRLDGFIQQPVGGPHYLLEDVAGDHVPGGGADDVVQAGHGAKLAADRLHEEQRIGDAPAGHLIDQDELLVLGRNLRRQPVPFDEPFVKVVRLLDKRALEVQAGRGDRRSDRLPELGNDYLMSLGDHVEHPAGQHQGHEDDEHEQPRDESRHHSAPPFCSCRNGRSACWLGSMMYFCFEVASTCAMASR